MKMGPDAFEIAENETGSPKHENGTDALRTTKNVSSSAKHENGTRGPRFGRKRVQARKTLKRDLTPSVPPKTILGAQNMKTGADAIVTR
jgi:hypothetical protein